MTEQPEALSALRPDEEAKFRESVRLLAEQDVDGPQWSNIAAQRLLATIDAARLPAASPALDVERLARLYMRVRGAHGPNGGAEDQGIPCDWCRLSAEQHVEVARLAEIHDS